MLVLFVLRLALGLLAGLLILSPNEIAPRFYRTHFLTVFSLGIIALIFPPPNEPSQLYFICLITAMIVSLLMALFITLEYTPKGRLSALMPLLGIGLAIWQLQDQQQPTWLLINDMTSAFFLGMTVTVMLLGHSYLISPTMSISPLMRLLVGVFIAIGLRLLIAGIALYFWTRHHSLFNFRDIAVLWLPMRWALGFIGPAVLTWMAWQCGKIRSTQSATGILYIAVVLCFLGELTAQLLLTETGYPL